jgi:hypothetical protein
MYSSHLAPSHPRSASQQANPTIGIQLINLLHQRYLRINISHSTVEPSLILTLFAAIPCKFPLRLDPFICSSCKSVTMPRRPNRACFECKTPFVDYELICYECTKADGNTACASHAHSSRDFEIACERCIEYVCCEFCDTFRCSSPKVWNLRFYLVVPGLWTSAVQHEELSLLSGSYCLRGL